MSSVKVEGVQEVVSRYMLLMCDTQNKNTSRDEAASVLDSTPEFSVGVPLERWVITDHPRLHILIALLYIFLDYFHPCSSAPSTPGTTATSRSESCIW